MGQRLMGIEPFMILRQVIVIIKNILFLELRHQAKWVLTIICNLLSIFKSGFLVLDAPTNYGQFWQGLFKENKNFNWKLLLQIGMHEPCNFKSYG